MYTTGNHGQGKGDRNIHIMLNRLFSISVSNMRFERQWNNERWVKISKRTEFLFYQKWNWSLIEVLRKVICALGWHPSGWEESTYILQKKTEYPPGIFFLTVFENRNQRDMRVHEEWSLVIVHVHGMMLIHRLC